MNYTKLYIVGILTIGCILFTSILISYDKTPSSPINRVLKWIDDYEEQRYKIDENANYVVPGKEYFNYNTFKENNILSIEESVEKDSIDFTIYTTDESYGFYHYYVWIKNIGNGAVYLKLYEYNHNKSLSIDDTAIQIGAMHSGVIKCGPRFFMIWDDFGVEDYLAKVELWYKPENSLKQKKLLTKIYRVRGFVD